MKKQKVLLIVFLMIVLLLVGGYVFLKTLDVNQFLPQIQKQVKDMTGRELSVGRAVLGVSWSQGVILDVRDIVLGDEPSFSSEAFLTIERVSLGVDLRSLIVDRKLQVAHVVVAGLKAIIIRDHNGRINAAQIGSISKKSEVDAKAVALPVLLVRDFLVEEATLVYVDEALSPRFGFKADHCTMSVKDFSLTEPFTYEFRSAVLSSATDVQLSGKAHLNLSEQSFYVDGLKGEVDLSKIDVKVLNRDFPMLAPLGIAEIRGRFNFDVRDLKIGSKGVSSFVVDAGFYDGFLFAKALPLPIEQIGLKMKADGKKLEATDITALFSDGKVSGHVIADNYLSKPDVHISVGIEGVELQRIAQAYKSSIMISGRAKAKADIAFTGNNPEEIQNLLKGKISGEMEDGALKGVSLWEQALLKFPLLAAMQKDIFSELSNETKADLEKGVTVISRAQVVAEIENGLLDIVEAEAVSRDFMVSVDGGVDLPDVLDLTATIIFSQDIVSRLEKKFPEIGMAKSDKGELSVPLVVTGNVASPSIRPDLKDISSKILSGKGRRELKKIISGNSDLQGVLDVLAGEKKVNDEQDSSVAIQPQEETNDVSTGKAVEAVFDMFRKR